MTTLSTALIHDRFIYGLMGHVPRNRAFVFGVGLSKTGTTSLNDALEVLGYKAFHLPPITKVTSQGEIMMDWPWWVYKYQALTDLSVAVLHRKLAKTFPRARFIYTHRELPAWLNSCEKHFTSELTERRIAQGQPHLNDLVTAFYGSRVFNLEQFRDAYMRHETDVLALHGGQENFLPYNLTAGEGWGPLCNFLGKAVPDLPFPVSNKASLSTIKTMP